MTHPICIHFGKRGSGTDTEVRLTIQEAQAMHKHLGEELKRIAALPLSDTAQAAQAVTGAYSGDNHRN